VPLERLFSKGTPKALSTSFFPTLAKLAFQKLTSIATS
jgi:hypothetical protein